MDEIDRMIEEEIPFNRTAYGIEMRLPSFLIASINTFNRTAYGIEIAIDAIRYAVMSTFNRTAYGIEIMKVISIP